MFRRIVNSLLSLLIVVTFMWGGCVSCEEYFMFPGKPQKSCCNKSGQCERPGKNNPSKTETQDCNRLPLQRGGEAHVFPLPAVLPTPIDLAAVRLCPQVIRLSVPDEILGDSSPPDLQALNVTFLI